MYGSIRRCSSPTTHENSAKHQGLVAIAVLLRVRQGQRRPPRAAEDDPLLNAEVDTKLRDGRSELQREVFMAVRKSTRGSRQPHRRSYVASLLANHHLLDVRDEVPCRVLPQPATTRSHMVTYMVKESGFITEQRRPGFLGIVYERNACCGIGAKEIVGEWKLLLVLKCFTTLLRRFFF